MRKMMLLLLALAATAAMAGSAPRAASAEDCYWYCIDGQGACSCGSPRLCPWPPPPIACLAN